LQPVAHSFWSFQRHPASFFDLREPCSQVLLGDLVYPISQF
jgi:hypothetical protein